LELLNDEIETLLSTLDDEDEAGKLRIENRGLVFRRVLEDAQVEIFSAPTSNPILGDKLKVSFFNKLAVHFVFLALKCTVMVRMS